MKTREYFSQIFEGELVSEEIIKFAFGFATILGSLLIFLLSFIEGKTFLLLLRFVLPLSIMGLYWIWFSQRDETESHTYAFADSFYYLGFIYTLVALLGSFLSGLVQGSGTINTDALIGNLGIALSTTIFGLGVRVYIVSFEPNADNTYKEMQRNLSNSSNALYIQIKTIIDKLSEFEQNNLTTLGNQTDALTLSLRNTASSSEELTQNLNKAAMAMGQARTSGEALSTSLAESKLTSDALGSSFSEATSKANALAEAEVNLEGVVRNASQTLNTAFDMASTLIDTELRAALRIINQSFTELVDEYVQQSKNSIKNFSGGIAEMSTQLGGVSEGISESAKQIYSGSGELTEAINAFKSNITSSSEALKRQRESLESITNAMSTINQSMASFAKTLETTTGLSGELESVSSGLKSILATIRTIANTDLSQAQIDAIQRLKDSIEGFSTTISELNEFGITVKQYGHESVEMIRLTEDALIENLARTTQRLRDS